MTQLEVLDRDLAYLERDFRAKEAAYIAAKDRFEKRADAKRLMVEQLTMLMLNAERRKEERVTALLARVQAGGNASDGSDHTTTNGSASSASSANARTYAGAGDV